MQPMGQMRNAGGQSGPQEYGAFGGSPEGKNVLARSQRQRLNIVSLSQALFFPWVLFCLLYAVMSFSLHYTNPAVCYLIAACTFLVVLMVGAIALSVFLRKMRSAGGEHEPNWYIFLFVTMLISWVLALVLGDLNFWSYLQPYYDYTSLNEYYYVDPARMRGQQLMDVAKVYFVNGTVLDLKRSMGFKNLDTYCVAPITVNAEPLASYDFWAVGLDCCSGNMADFACGEYNNPNAQGGLRLLRDDQRAFYRLAVQQAEAAYNIKATHPLFFYWSQDPAAEMQSFRDEGVRYYLIGMLAHFGWSFFAVALAGAGFAKLGMH